MLSLSFKLYNQESKKPVVNETLHSIQNLVLSEKNVQFCWVPSHVGIPGNEQADRAARDILNSSQQVPHNYKMPYTDFIQKIKIYIMNKWKQRWGNHGGRKLKEIMPELKHIPINNMTRKDEVIFHRIRIGHTRLNHSFLTEGQRVEPVYHFCMNDNLTVKHLLLNCGNFNHYRIQDILIYGRITTIQELFDKVPPRKIIDFLRHTNLYEKM